MKRIAALSALRAVAVAAAAAMVVVVIVIAGGSAFVPSLAAAAAETFALRWVTSPPATNAPPGTRLANAVHVELSGLSRPSLDELQRVNWAEDRWQRLLAVRTEPDGGNAANASGLPAMVGEYRVEKNSVLFLPRFPLTPGMRYRAVFSSGGLPEGSTTESMSLTSVFETPAPAARPPTVVRRVYPSTGVLPENQLKFYIQFSGPMSRGEIYSHIHLREESGREVELPFLQINEELWDPDLTRLTLFIDPGRIKRGVRPLEEVGPALVNGRRYTLVIDPAWLDGGGQPLGKPFEKKFRVGPPDRTPPDPKTWRLQAPRRGTREPVRLTFPDPMDHALALRLIQVVDATGHVVDGTADLGEEERLWLFTSAKPWPAGAYQLVVATTIEDLAGNNIGKPFEVDLFENVQRQLSSPSIQLPFEVK